jgi:hypothetical protein
MQVGGSTCDYLFLAGWLARRFCMPTCAAHLRLQPAPSPDRDYSSESVILGDEQPGARYLVRWSGSRDPLVSERGENTARYT